MIRLTTTLSFLFFCSIAFAQTFEGKITYHTTYVSRTPGATDKEYNSMLGNNQIFFIKGGNYKYEDNGTFLLWHVYINKDNKIYSKIAHSSTIVWDDVSVNLDKITSAEVHKGVTTILGYLCDEVILHYESNYQKYYYSSKLGIDSKLFVNHKLNSWYAYLAKANAVPLKISIRNYKYFMESIATEVKPMKIPDSFFTIPAGSKTEKSPF